MPVFLNPAPIATGGSSITGDGEISNFDNKLRITHIPDAVMQSANRMPPGDAGAQGEDGSPGAPGSVGPAGAPGAQGAPGVPGVPGDPGADGESGLPGIPGPQGAQGNPGSQGPAGQPGPPGEVGDTGEQGNPGPVGPAGLDGATGAQGPAGVPGPPGETGDIGDDGPIGPQGIQGTTGATGQQGAAGVPGPPGERGDDGDDGAQGIQGPQGIQGITGTTGPQGIPGFGIPGSDGADAENSAGVPFAWNLCLTAGNRSGGNNVMIDVGQFTNYGLDGPTLGNPQIRSGDATFRLRGANTVIITGDTNLALNSTAGAAQLNAFAGNVQIAASGLFSVSTGSSTQLQIETTGEWTTPTGGALGKVLTHQGAGASPIWAAPTGGSGTSGPSVPGMDGQDGDTSGIMIQQVTNSTVNTVAGTPPAGIVLSATTHTLEIVTVSGADISYEFSFMDVTSSTITPGSTQGTITGAATTTVVTAPAASTQRIIVGATLQNIDTFAQTATVQKDVSATNTVIVSAIAIGTGERLEYTSHIGWRIFDSAGREKKGVTVIFNSTSYTVNPGEQVGLDITAGGAGSAVALTGLQQGENIRTSGAVTDATAGAINNFALLSTCKVLILSSDCVVSGFSISGIPNPEGFEFDLQAGTSNKIQLLSQSGLSSAGNTIAMPSSIPYIINNREVIRIKYRAGFWRVQELHRMQSNDPLTFASMTGAQGFIDISGQMSGFQLTVQAIGAAASIAGFTFGGAISSAFDGFWFDLIIRDSTTPLMLRLIENSGNSTSAIRCPNSQHYYVGRSSNVRFVYSNSRWRVMNVPVSNQPSADFMYLREDFVSGVESTSASGFFGDLGWRCSASDTGGIYKTSETNHPGIVSILTDPTTNDVEFMSLFANGIAAAAGEGIVDPTQIASIEWVVRVVSTAVGARYFMGLIVDPATADSNTVSCIGIAYDSAIDVNWNLQTKNVSSSRTDTGVAVTAAHWYKFQLYQNSATSWSLVVNDTVVVTNATNIPTGILQVCCQVTTLSNAAVTLDVDYFSIQSMQLNRFT